MSLPSRCRTTSPDSGTTRPDSTISNRSCFHWARSTTSRGYAVLRIHFTTADLGRIHFAATIGVAAETHYALECLSDRHQKSRLQASTASPLSDAEIHGLVSLLPDHGAGLDLLSLAGDAPSIEHAVENLLHLPNAQWRREFENIAFRPRYASWVKSVSAGGLAERRKLASALRACHRLLVAPSWETARSDLVAASARHVDVMLGGGADALLRQLCPTLVRWRPPVLECAYPRRIDARLQGRGLIITPTLFAGRAVSFLWDSFDTARAPRLTVPVAHGSTTGSFPDGPDSSARLQALLGRTRAAALKTTTAGCTTTEMAVRLDVSVAAASQHAKILRTARLITTSRRGGSVFHRITPLGVAVLSGAHPTDPPDPYE